MRIVPLAAAVVVLAACGSAGEVSRGGGGEYTVTAALAPLPAHAGARHLYGLDHVACARVGECVATGELITSSLHGLLLVEHGGKWTLTEPPLPRQPGTGAKRDVTMGSISCPAVGRCIAVGTAQSGGQSEPLVFTQQPGGWRETVLPFPAGANGGGLRLVSCPSVGNCTAAGNYVDSAGRQEGLFVTESDGRWGTPTTAVLPANAGTVADGEAPEIDALSCPSPGDCTAVGLYGDAVGSPQGLLLTETHGRWARGVEARLPANATESEGSYLYPVIGLGSVSCTSAGNCTALGGYVDRHENQFGMILTEHAGRWATAVETPLPANAGPNPQQGNVPASPLGPIVCPSAGSCSAVGSYWDTRDRGRGLLLAEQAGRWTASEPVLPSDAGGERDAGLFALACSSAGNCLASGTYPAGDAIRLLFVTEHDGRWADGVEVPLPAGANEADGGYVTSISCPSASYCLAVGSYDDKSGGSQGMLVTIRP